MVETLALTWFGREVYLENLLSKMNTWVNKRKAQGKRRDCILSTIPMKR